MTRANLLIKKLQLKPHPEGGYFKETYRCNIIISQSTLPDEYKSDRNVSTAIYFLLESDHFSAFHKINQDEIWHFYEGSSIAIHQIAPNGDYSKIIIGNKIENGEIPQYVVPSGYWFAANVVNPNDYSLVGCTVAPGFDFEDFLMPNRDELTTLFPQHSKIITKYSRA